MPYIQYCIIKTHFKLPIAKKLPKKYENMTIYWPQFCGFTTYMCKTGYPQKALTETHA